MNLFVTPADAMEKHAARAKARDKQAKHEYPDAHRWLHSLRDACAARMPEFDITLHWRADKDTGRLTGQVALRLESEAHGARRYIEEEWSAFQFASMICAASDHLFAACPRVISL